VQNVEVKYELRDPDAARLQCRVGNASLIGTLHQVDTYYRMSDGRLKRRVAEGEPVEWIFYHRIDRARPRLSTFTILSEEQARTRWGVQGLRPWVEVEKTRELWLDGALRIHLDEVRGLGNFLELEALIGPGSDLNRCHESIDRWRTLLLPVLGEPVSHSYSDLAAREEGAA